MGLDMGSLLCLQLLLFGIGGNINPRGWDFAPVIPLTTNNLTQFGLAVEPN